MNLETADAAFQNVLAACDKPPNTIPSSKVILQQKPNTHLYDRLLILTVALLILTFLLPLGIVPMEKLVERQPNPEPVTLVNDYVENNFLYLELSGGGNILYEEAWMTSVDGEKILGIYDKSTGLVSFPFPDSGEYNIYSCRK